MNNSSNNAVDVYQVGVTARLLGVSEFKLFEESYHAWHGDKPSEELVEYFFKNYLLEGVVPFWVRNHVRKFLKDPTLREGLGNNGKVAAYCHVVPIVVEYILIMYFLL